MKEKQVKLKMAYITEHYISFFPVNDFPNFILKG